MQNTDPRCAVGYTAMSETMIPVPSITTTILNTIDEVGNLVAEDHKTLSELLSRLYTKEEVVSGTTGHAGHPGISGSDVKEGGSLVDIRDRLYRLKELEQNMRWVINRLSQLF